MARSQALARENSQKGERAAGRAGGLFGVGETSDSIYVQRFKPGQVPRRESLLCLRRRCGGSWRGFLHRGTRGARRKHSGTPAEEKIITPQVSCGPPAALVALNLGKKRGRSEMVSLHEVITRREHSQCCLHTSSGSECVGVQ